VRRPNDTLENKVRRFEQALHELIDEGHSILNYRGLLEAAAKRAGVEIQEVHPTVH
jgi:hypothetical protein